MGHAGEFRRPGGSSGDIPPCDGQVYGEAQGRSHGVRRGRALARDIEGHTINGQANLVDL